jgi:hypothetical protein
MLERKSVVQQYVDMLSGQDEGTWREMLIGMGAGTDVPKVFRHAGKVPADRPAAGPTGCLLVAPWPAACMQG